MRRLGAIALLLPILLSVNLAQAQEFETARLNEGEGIPIGPFVFSPAIELTWERTDNVFFTPANQVEDDIYIAKGRLQLELPFHESYIRFVYSPKYRQYKTYEDLPEKMAHFFDVLGSFEFANGLELEVAYHYISANLETQEGHPGGEHVFGLWQYDTNDLMAKLSFWLTHTDAVFIQGTYNDTTHDQRESYFYDFSRHGLAVGWTHQLSETAKFDLLYRREEFEAEDTMSYIRGSSYRDSTSDELSLGLYGRITETLNSELRIGWRETTFKTTSLDPKFDDFSGAVADGYLSWEMAHGSTLTLHLLRWDYPSAYEQNAYYTATGGGLQYDLNLGRLFGRAHFRLQQNEYEVEDQYYNVVRTDDITMWGVRVGYWLTDWLSIRGGYRHEDRESLTPYEFDVNIIHVGLTVGY
jgi:hypothetical protein